MNPKRTITDEMLRNMEMLAVTNPAMKDILEQARMIYTLAGSPDYFEDDVDKEEEEADLLTYSKRYKTYAESKKANLYDDLRKGWYDEDDR